MPEVNAFILSRVFWPNFREEKLKLPDFIQRYKHAPHALCKHCQIHKGHFINVIFNHIDSVMSWISVWTIVLGVHT